MMKGHLTMHLIRPRAALASFAFLLTGTIAAQITADDMEAAVHRPPWTPTASEVEIAFRVDFPEGTLKGEDARLILEASEPDNGDPNWGWHVVFGRAYVAVDSTPVADGQVVQLCMPLNADKVRVRLEASYMTPATTGLDAVEPGRPPIVIRPDAASKIRIVIENSGAGGINLRTLLGTACSIDVNDHARWQPQSWSTPLVVDATGGAELLAIPSGATLSLPTLGGVLLETGEERGVRTPIGVGLTGDSHHVSDAPDQVWRLRAVPLASFEGRVVSTTGEVLEHAMLRIPLAQGFTQSGANGRFRLVAWPQLEPGASLTVSARGHQDWQLNIAEPIVGSQALDLGAIQLEPHRAITGQLTLSDGRPVAGFPLTISTSYPRPRSGDNEIRTGPDGRFQFDAVGASSVILRGWARLDLAGRVQAADSKGSMSAYELAPIRVSAGDVNLHLNALPVHVFEGHVEFDDGAPVQTVFVAAQIRALPGTDHVPQGGGADRGRAPGRRRAVPLGPVACGPMEYLRLFAGGETGLANARLRRGFGGAALPAGKNRRSHWPCLDGRRLADAWRSRRCCGRPWQDVLEQNGRAGDLPICADSLWRLLRERVD